MDIDRRIAIEVFGEEEPPEPDELCMAVIADRWRDGDPAYSKGKAWSYRVSRARWGWHPLRFSSSLEEAERAFEKFAADWRAQYPSWRNFPHSATLHILRTFDGREIRLRYRAGFGQEYHFGQTIPEAICNLLLALKEKK